MKTVSVGDTVYFKYLSIERMQVTKGVVGYTHPNGQILVEVATDGDGGSRLLVIDSENLSTEALYDKWEEFYAKQSEISKAQSDLEKLRTQLRLTDG